MTIEQIRVDPPTVPVFNRASLPTARPGIQYQPTVFIDRDGVINHNRVNHVLSWNDFQFVDGSIKAMALLHQAGYQVIVVTNQAAITRGLISVQELDFIHRRMEKMIEEGGGKVKGIFYCRHLPTANCDCRKPKPGLLFQAARQFKIDLPTSWLVGDHITDIQAAIAAGVKPLLVLTGRGQATYENWLLTHPPSLCPSGNTAEFTKEPLLIVKANLLEAVEFILADVRIMV